MRIGVTSIVRAAGPGEPSGFLRIVEIDEKRVSATFTLPESVHRLRDPNPRGGNRGAKGIGTDGARVVVANVERLFLLDGTWRIAQAFSHPWLGGIHDLLVESDGIWVTCADADLLVKMAWDGRIVEAWTWRTDARLAAELGFRRRPRFDASLDYRDPMTTHTGVTSMVHLNAVTRAQDGLLLSFGRILSPRRVFVQRAKAAAASPLRRTRLGERAVAAVVRRRGQRIDAQGDLPVERLEASSSAIVRLEGTNGNRRARVLTRMSAPAGVPNHNVLRLNGRLVYNDSNQGVVVAYDHQRDIREGVALQGAHRFPRGLHALDDNVVLVGSQKPAALHAVDLGERRVRWSLSLSVDPRETVYAIAPVPDTFDDAPGGALASK